MIIGIILRLIKKVIDLVAALIAWLFVTLGLWVPFVYCLIFVIGCAIKGIELSSVSTLFFLGLFLSLIASVALSVHLAGRKFKRKEKRANVLPALGKRRDKVTLVSSPEAEDSLPDEGLSRPDVLTKKERKSKKEAEPAEKEEKKPPVNIIEAARADAQRKLVEDGYVDEESVEERAIPDREEQTSYAQAPVQPEQTDCMPVVTKGGYNPEEMPRIFATRKDPTVYIYEYKSRLDFYKRTRMGMIYMYSEYKS